MAHYFSKILSLALEVYGIYSELLGSHVGWVTYHFVFLLCLSQTS
jgi:hypothetical protein